MKFCISVLPNHSNFCLVSPVKIFPKVLEIIKMLFFFDKCDMIFAISVCFLYSLSLCPPFFLFSLRWADHFCLCLWAVLPFLGLLSHTCNSLLHQVLSIKWPAVAVILCQIVACTMTVNWHPLFDSCFCMFCSVTLVSHLLSCSSPIFPASPTEVLTCFLSWSPKVTVRLLISTLALWISMEKRTYLKLTYLVSAELFPSFGFKPAPQQSLSQCSSVSSQVRTQSKNSQCNYCFPFTVGLC